MDFDLRLWRPDDAASLARYADNRKIAAQLRDAFPSPYRLEDAQMFIGSCLADADRTRCCRAIVVGGEAVGSIGAFPQEDVYRKSAEIGYWLAEPFWGRGIMSEAIRRMCEEACRRYGVIRILAEPFANNAGSRRALEKAGFSLEGILRQSVYKNGVILDSCMYARIFPENQA